MTVGLPCYSVYAVRYATRAGRRPDHFIGGDPHDGDMPMDYFIWLLRDGKRVILVDTGFDAALALKRNRTLLRTPRAGLALLGVATEDIRDVIVTHMHNDHAGTLKDFPSAIFHVQDDEMAFVTGRNMRHERFRRSFELEHVLNMVEMVFLNRVQFHKGDDDIAPGVTIHQIGGHTPGMQAVRVHTQRGWLVLASDASHYYEHIENGRCFPAVYNVGDVLEGYDRMRRLAESASHIIPGHDPLVMHRYGAPTRDMEGMVVRLDAVPFA